MRPAGRAAYRGVPKGGDPWPSRATSADGGGREAEPDRLPPGQYLVDDFPVLSAGPTPHTPLDEWTFSIAATVERAARWTWDEFRALPERDAHGGHPLRHASGRSSTRPGRACRWTRCSTGVEHDAAVRARVLRRRLHDEPAARGRHRRQGVGRVRVRRRAARSRARRPGAAARSAPLLLEERQVGARPRAARRRRARLLGVERLPQLRRPVAGAAVLQATELAARDGRRGGRAGDAARADARPRRAGLAGPPRRPARRRPADRRGRLPGRARVLDRVGARASRSSSPSSCSTTARSRRTSSTWLRAGDEFELRGPIGGYFVWDAGARRAAAPRRGRLGRRAAAGDAPPRAPPGSTSRRGSLYSSRTLEDVIYRDELEEPRRRARGASITLTREQPRGWTGLHAPRRRARCSARSRGRPRGDRSRSSAGRRASSRRSRRASSSSATSRRASRPNGSEPTGGR